MVDVAFRAMIEYFGQDRALIGHTMRVYGFCRAIALRERIGDERMRDLECAAIFHDIGIPESRRVFDSEKWEYHEAMGAKVALELMQSLQFPLVTMNRVAFLVRNHHSYKVEGGPALQALFEAEALASLDDGTFVTPPMEPLEVRDWIFRTKTGIELLDSMFGIPLRLP